MCYYYGVPRPKKADGEASIAFSITMTPQAKSRLERMMSDDSEPNRSRWLNELVDEEWGRRRLRRRVRTA